MTNFSRHRPEDTLEWFYQEWHGEHVDIMRRSPGVMRLVRRYVQNRALHDPTLPTPEIPLAPEGWDGASQLTFDGVAEFVAGFDDADYVANVRDHRLSDPTVVVTLLTEAEAVVDSPPREGAVKLTVVHQLADPDRVGDFESDWAGSFSTAVHAAGPIRRHVRNRVAASVSPEVFVGTRWEGVAINRFAGYDELWFDSRDQLSDFLDSEGGRSAFSRLRDAHLTPRSFSFIGSELIQIDSLGYDGATSA